MKKLVPLISSSVAGPLGVVHLPRTWLKAILAQADALYEGWTPGYRGFNKSILDVLGVDQEAFFTYMATMPTYPETERWVRANARNLDEAAIVASNVQVLSWERPEDAAAQARERVGLRNSTLRLSSRLNDLDDWYTLHAWITAHRGEKLDPIVPTVSSSSAGPLGVKHLPRLWVKALLNAVGALPETWNSGCGFDAYVADVIGLDLPATIDFIHEVLPDYLTFERWVGTRLPALEPATIAIYNAAIGGRLKPEEKAAAERAEAGVPELTFREAIMCNDMIDWKTLHDEAVARRATHA